MTKDGRQGALYVIGHEIAAVFQRGYGLRDTHEADGCAGAGAEGERGPFAGAADEGEDVGEQFGFDADGLDFAAGGGEQAGGNGFDVGGFQDERALCGEVEFEDVALVGFVGVEDESLQKETIQLGFGEWIGALEVDGVLRSEDGKVGGQRADDAVSGDLALFHAFEQSGLGARGHAVDFVNQEQVGEDCACVKTEFVGALQQDCGTEDVGGHQVGRGLDAMEAEAEQAGERFDDEGLGDARDAFEEDVALDEECHEGFVDDAGLAGDDAAQLGAGVVEELAGGVELGVSRDGGLGAYLIVCFLGHVLLSVGSRLVDIFKSKNLYQSLMLCQSWIRRR